MPKTFIDGSADKPIILEPGRVEKVLRLDLNGTVLGEMVDRVEHQGDSTLVVLARSYSVRASTGGVVFSPRPWEGAIVLLTDGAEVRVDKGEEPVPWVTVRRVAD